jgi:hypothetical protein
MKGGVDAPGSKCGRGDAQRAGGLHVRTRQVEHRRLDETGPSADPALGAAVTGVVTEQQEKLNLRAVPCGARRRPGDREISTLM